MRKTNFKVADYFAWYTRPSVFHPFSTGIYVYIKGPRSPEHLCAWKYPPGEQRVRELSVLLFSVGMSLASLHLSLTRPAHPPARALLLISHIRIYYASIHQRRQLFIFFSMYLKAPGAGNGMSKECDAAVADEKQRQTSTHSATTICAPQRTSPFLSTQIFLMSVEQNILKVMYQGKIYVCEWYTFIFYVMVVNTKNTWK